jgi:RNA polymerase sigma-70 factor, ECF subfamily
MVEGPKAGLAVIEALAAGKDLENYHLLQAARADLLRRIGSAAEAATSYRRPIALVTNNRERRYLERRLQQVQWTADEVAT